MALISDRLEAGDFTRLSAYSRVRHVQNCRIKDRCLSPRFCCIAGKIFGYHDYKLRDSLRRWVPDAGSFAVWAELAVLDK